MRKIESDKNQPKIDSFFNKIDNEDNSEEEDAPEITKKSKVVKDDNTTVTNTTTTVKKATKAKKPKKVLNEDKDEEEKEEKDEEEEEEKGKVKSKAKAKPKAKATKKRTKEEIDEEEEEEEEEEKKEEAVIKNPNEYDNLFDHLTEESWKIALKDEITKTYIKTMIKNINGAPRPIYPPQDEVFTAFNRVPLDKVKVVIVGQDPYHGPGQAHGLCFSVKKGISPPPSLINMYKELKNTIEDFEAPKHGFLQSWADQGVFLLNAVMTVTQAKPNSHEKFGWATFTDTVMDILNKQPGPIVFILWGGFAKKKGSKIDKKKHHVLESGHPSPLSVKHFMGCDHFRKANEFLKSKDLTEIDWKLPATI
ncbi:uracil glycosylase [Tieghemostelium lacteum]|uniref:Uracil-DNA glycosylase n=1 Tax=Tieghemostelium lacteum TaxID=361077 RepID=A0A151Z806_TIELA|nr:uracil glycosylase [Tieghemostelium lacteum]|eukprot:KYQ90077.1 uracil glycosylase [Tieghemostelium lacteum]